MKCAGKRTCPGASCGMEQELWDRQANTAPAPVSSQSHNTQPIHSWTADSWIKVISQLTGHPVLLTAL